MAVQRIAAFTDGLAAGNPVGVFQDDRLPSAARMQEIAADVGYFETAFAAPVDGAWRFRRAKHL